MPELSFDPVPITIGLPSEENSNQETFFAAPLRWVFAKICQRQT